MDEVKDYEAYTVGLCCASVCALATLPIEEIAKRLNAEHPTGIESQWQLSKDKTFKGGEPHPCACNTSPETHKHYLFNC